jgi:uncharacterized protein
MKAAATLQSAQFAQPTPPLEHAPMGDAWVIRLKPDEDLVDGLVAVCHAQHIQRASIVGGLGSLMHGCLAQGQLAKVHIDGPGVEILAITGWIDAMQPKASTLHLTLGDRHGNVTMGLAVKGCNPVCVTAEIILQEWKHVSI